MTFGHTAPKHTIKTALLQTKTCNLVERSDEDEGNDDDGDHDADDGDGD